MTKAESMIPEAASDPVIRQIFDLVPEAKDEVVQRPTLCPCQALIQDSPVFMLLSR